MSRSPSLTLLLLFGSLMSSLLFAQESGQATESEPVAEPEPDTVPELSQEPDPEPESEPGPAPEKPLPDSGFEYKFLDPAQWQISAENPAIVAFGVGINRGTEGSAAGFYMSGMTPITRTPLGVYGRGEVIRDRYPDGHYWSWNMAIGLGLYRFKAFTPFVTVGKCFSSYSTCYFHTGHPTANDDIDAIYYGGGAYINSPFPGGVFELSFDWSPYKKYHGRAFYLGYGFTF